MPKSYLELLEGNTQFTEALKKEDPHFFDELAKGQHPKFLDEFIDSVQPVLNFVQELAIELFLGFLELSLRDVQWVPEVV